MRLRVCYLALLTVLGILFCAPHTLQRRPARSRSLLPRRGTPKHLSPKPPLRNWNAKAINSAPTKPSSTRSTIFEPQPPRPQQPQAAKQNWHRAVADGPLRRRPQELRDGYPHGPRLRRRHNNLGVTTTCRNRRRQQPK